MDEPWGHNLDAMTAFLLTLCSNVLSLRIDIREEEVHRYLYAVLDRAASMQLKELFHSSLALLNLTTIEVCFDADMGTHIANCMPFLGLKHLKYFDASSVTSEWDETGEDEKRLADTWRTRTAFAASLSLRDCAVEGADSINFLKCCKTLRAFNFSNMQLSNSTKADDFDKGLAHLTDCLEVLTITDDGPAGEYDHIPMMSLPSFQKLTTLTLPVYMLIELTTGINGRLQSSKSWFSLLPESLHTLGLSVCSRFQGPTIVHLALLVSYQDVLRPNLRVLQHDLDEAESNRLAIGARSQGSRLVIERKLPPASFLDICELMLPVSLMIRRR